MKRVSPFMLSLKSCVFILLAAFSFNAVAGAVYVGNPSRPHTIWVPGKCVNGCWKQGYYMKFLNPPVCCKNVKWVSGCYDKCGNWVSGHWKVRDVVVVGHVK